MHESEKWKWSHWVVSNSQRHHGLQPTRILRPWDFPGKSTAVGCHCLLRLPPSYFRAPLSLWDSYLVNLPFFNSFFSSLLCGQFKLSREELLAIIFFSHPCQLSWILNPQLNLHDPAHYDFSSPTQTYLLVFSYVYKVRVKPAILLLVSLFLYLHCLCLCCCYWLFP